MVRINDELARVRNALLRGLAVVGIERNWDFYYALSDLRGHAGPLFH